MSVAFLVCVAALFGLAAIGVPIALAMLVGAAVYLGISGRDLGLAAEQMIQGTFNGFIVLAVPLFIFAANVMNAGTISDRLMNFCIAVVGRFRGGLAYVNIVTSVIFSGMSGSAIADAAGIGKITTEMMIKGGRYDRGFSAGLTAATAVIGPIIPPSIPMVMYALVSDTSIGYLFLGGIGPGLLITLVLSIHTFILARVRQFPVEAPVPLRKIPGITFEALPALMMPVVLLAGIYGGAVTPTEAAAIAAAYALVLAAFFYRALSLRDLYRVISESARSSAAIGLVIAAALVLNYIVASENIPNLLAGALAGREFSPLGFMLSLNILILILGCFLDASTIILVVIPLFIPTCNALGIDLVYFGVIIVVNAMIGLITPPYGMLLFVIDKTTGITVTEQTRAILPFFLILVVALLGMILVPDVILWLPEQFGYRPA
ncbi:MAG TPA: TRAP transporter large permease [Bauldia sp.]|nr:TRAP transporter large permease [Bauldia sp.]